MLNIAGAEHHHSGGTLLAGAEESRGHHDAYHAYANPAELTWCPGCGAVFDRGEWHWAERPGEAVRALCAACQRTRHGRPAGLVQIDGDYARAHREEILALLQRCADQARAERPQQRIMAVTDTTMGVQVATTDSQLAHELARLLQRTHRGELKLHYSDAQVLLRAQWRR
jgi:NMD protein affecting ribosome stability and mRNA decay